MTKKLPREVGQYRDRRSTRFAWRLNISTDLAKRGARRHYFILHCMPTKCWRKVHSFTATSRSKDGEKIAISPTKRVSIGSDRTVSVFSTQK